MHYFASNIKLLRKRKNISQQALADDLGITRSMVKALENLNSQPTVAHLMSFSKYFQMAIDTLLKVDMGKLSESQFTELYYGNDVYLRGSNERVIAIKVDENNNDTIEYIPEKAKAGYSTGFADVEYIEKLPIIQLPFLSAGRKYRAFQISGDSMLPIPDGSIVIGEYIQDFYGIKSGEPYIVITREDGIVFKVVDNLLENNKSFRLSSLNELYEPFTLPSGEILEVWKFVCYINSEFPEPLSKDEHVIKMIRDIKVQLENNIK